MFKVSTALLAGALALALAASLGSAADARSARGERPAPVGSDPFVSGYGYRGDFPDPSVLRVGNTWFAYSTTVGGLNLPVLRSTDLVHWQARGEGLTKPAPWAVKHKKGRVRARDHVGAERRAHRPPVRALLRDPPARHEAQDVHLDVALEVPGPGLRRQAPSAR